MIHHIHQLEEANGQYAVLFQLWSKGYLQPLSRPLWGLYHVASGWRNPFQAKTFASLSEWETLCNPLRKLSVLLWSLCLERKWTLKTHPWPLRSLRLWLHRRYHSNCRWFGLQQCLVVYRPPLTQLSIQATRRDCPDWWCSFPYCELPSARTCGECQYDAYQRESRIGPQLLACPKEPKPNTLTSDWTLTPSSFQFGSNSFSPLGWKQFPEMIWEPICAPFSIRHTERSMFFSSASCLILMAAERPKLKLRMMMMRISDYLLGLLLRSKRHSPWNLFRPPMKTFLKRLIFTGDEKDLVESALLYVMRLLLEIRGCLIFHNTCLSMSYKL